MRRYVLSLVAVAFATTLCAQSAQEEIKGDIRLSASNHLAYPGPSQWQLTPAPQGKKPFYISHYGRHGSRYLINPRDYDYPLGVLRDANEEGMLTDLGREVLERVGSMKEEATGRMGELSPLGAVQHREIARRMYNRFPEVFEDGCLVDAKSTVVIRCILSMENELLEFMRLNPQLRFLHDASEHDMNYMNFEDFELFEQRWDSEADSVYGAYCERYVNPDYLICKVFTDTAYAHRNIDISKFYERMFKLASTIQNTEARTEITLYDLFTDRDVYNNWKCSNVWWYMRYGAYTPNGGKQPFSQRRLLRKIIEEADSCLKKEAPGATLRFGHETMVLPLTCLLGINGADLETADISRLEQKGWVNYRIFPMGANIQIVFYRSDLQDDDVLVKVLLNENETSLPIKTDNAPYYHWKDFREYYLNKIDEYEEGLQLEP